MIKRNRLVQLALCFAFGALSMSAQDVPDVIEEIEVEESVVSYVPGMTAAQAAADKFQSDPIMRYASLGISVMDINTLREVSVCNSMVADIPASTMKTVTCATAIGILGPDYRFATYVKLQGNKNSDGTFTGKIIVEGGGDPTLESKHFEREQSFCANILEALKSQGIKSVVGKIEVHTCSPVDAYPANWPLDDIVWDYGAGAFLFNYADNCFTMSFAMEGDKVTLTKCNPAVPGITLKNEINYFSAKSGVPVSGIEAYRDINSSEIILAGFSPRKDKKTVSGYTLSIPDPAAYFKKCLASYLNANGVKFTEKDGVTTSGAVTDLTVYYSPMLSDIAQSALERSDNMFTECILRAIGHQRYHVWSEKVSVRDVKKYWEAKGLSVGALFMNDGSGLSRRNKISARFLASLLSTAQTSGLGANFNYASILPIAGVNGTVKPLLQDTPYQGKFAVKSGSMGEVLCYAGLYPLENPKYAIVVLTNNFSTNYRGMRKRIQDFLLELLPALDAEKNK